MQINFCDVKSRMYLNKAWRTRKKPETIKFSADLDHYNIANNITTCELIRTESY